MCLISYLYMPFYADHIDVGTSIAVRALRDDFTILPLILAETLISASFCRTVGDQEFRGSPVLLYIWFMTHLRPIGRLHRHRFCFGHGMSQIYSYRPTSYIDEASWTAFLGDMEEPFERVMYSGYCSFLSFTTYLADLDFLPLVGLRGVMTYHPLAVMGQFDQYQDVHSFEGTEDYRFPICSATEADLARVCGFGPIGRQWSSEIAIQDDL